MTFPPLIMKLLLLPLALLLGACAGDRREYHPPVASTPASQSSSAYRPPAVSDARRWPVPEQYPSSSYADPRGASYSRLPQAEAGEVLGLRYDESPGVGAATFGFLGGVAFNSISPLGFISGPGAGHVPTYHIRLANGGTAMVRDPDCPPLVRGSRVIVLRDAGGRPRIVPDRRR